MFHGIGAGRRRFAIEANIIGMDIDQRHAAVLGDPVQFLKPDGRSLFAQEQEERGILGEGVREFDIAVGGDYRTTDR